MSQSPPSSDSHSPPNIQNRRLSIIQGTAVDDLRDINTHALDSKSPLPHHESSMMSYLESHSPNDETSHECSPRSPLISRSNSVVDEKVELVLEGRNVEKTIPRGKVLDLGSTPPEPSANTSPSKSEVKEASTPKSAMDVWKEM